MNYSIPKTVWALAPMAIALSLAMDIYVPCLPRLATIFNTSVAVMQLTLNIFMLACALVQLIIGPLSDQYGRRIISYISILIFAAGSVCCAMAQSASGLIAFRIIQATGSIGMLVVGNAIVRDRYSGKACATTYSYLNGIIAFSPMFAPFIGSFLDVHFGWQSAFLALLVVALWAGINIYFWVPESLAADRRIPVTLNLFKEYYEIFFNRQFFFYTLFSAMGLSYLFIFCSISPYIIISLLHIPELDYGYYFAFMGISFFLGGILSGFVVGKLGIFYTTLLGAAISLAGGLLMTTWYFVYGLSIANFIWPMLLIGMGGTFQLGAGAGGSMEPFGDKAGAASALGGSFRFLFSGLLGTIIIHESINSTLPLSLPAVIFSVVSLGILAWYRRYLKSY